jgi:hypothetical protein
MEHHLLVLLAASFACLGMFAVAWRFRVRAVRRLLTAFESFAKREIAQERRRKVRKRTRAFSSASAVVSSRDVIDRGEGRVRRMSPAGQSTPPAPVNLRLAE